MDWRSPFRRSMDGLRVRVPKNDGNVPWALLICLLTMSLVFVIAIPILGFMYMDMNNATIAAMREIRKMRAIQKEHELEKAQRNDAK